MTVALSMIQEGVIGLHFVHEICLNHSAPA